MIDERIQLTPTQNTLSFLQLVDVLRTHLSLDEYARAVPSLEQLWSQYGLEPSVAFHVVRHKLSADVDAHDAAAKVDAVKTEASLKAQLRKPKVEETPSDADAMAVDGEVKEETVVESTPPVKPSKAVKAVRVRSAMALNETDRAQWHPVLEPTIELARSLLPATFTQFISPGFFVTFWQLSLHDLTDAAAAYKHTAAQIEDVRRHLPDRLAPVDLSKKVRDELTGLMTYLPALATELSAEAIQHYTREFNVTRRLRHEKDGWITGAITGGKDKHEMVVLLQHCFLPRLRLSPVDATYAARFLFKMHSLGPSRFRTLLMLDRIFVSSWTTTVQSFTENEAHSFGVFLRTLLGTVLDWRANEQAYTSEALYGVPRGETVPKGAKPLPGMSQKLRLVSVTSEADLLSHAKWVTICDNKWQASIRDVRSAMRC